MANVQAEGWTTTGGLLDGSVPVACDELALARGPEEIPDHALCRANGPRVRRDCVQRSRTRWLDFRRWTLHVENSLIPRAGFRAVPGTARWEDLYLPIARYRARLRSHANGWVRRPVPSSGLAQQLVTMRRSAMEGGRDLLLVGDHAKRARRAKSAAQ